MKNSSSENKHFLKIDKGEDFLSILTSFIKSKRIGSGTLTAIGVLKDVELGYYEIKTNEYKTRTFLGEYELVSCLGNIGYLKGEAHPHIHVIIADDKFNCYGGHLLKGTVGITLEIFIIETGMELERIYDQELGLNLLSPRPL